MFALVHDGSIVSYPKGNKGITIDDIQYPQTIFTLWTEEERNAIGIYTVEIDNSNFKDETFFTNTNQTISFDEDENRFRNGSVHCFIDKKTGEVYKAASWQNPAKHVRYDMRIIKDREFLHNPDNIDWAGGHLYMR